MSSVALILALLAAGAFPWPLPQEAHAPAATLAVGRPSHACEREALVRTWARDPLGERDALLEALADASDWTRGAAALDALVRALESAAPGLLGAEGDPRVRELRRAVMELLEQALGKSSERGSGSAGLRALDRGLRVAALWPGGFELSASALAAAARQPDPHARMALVQLLGRRVDGGDEPGSASIEAELLLELLDDSDERVAREARRVLVRHPGLAQAGPPGRGEAWGAVREAASGAVRGQGAGVAAGLTAEELERLCAPAELLSESSPLGLALEVRLHASAAAAEHLAAVWASAAARPGGAGEGAEAADSPAERAVLLRAARAARAAGLPLAVHLREALARERDPARQAWLIEGLLAADDPGCAAPELAVLDPELGCIAFELLVGREVAWDRDATAPLLDPAQAGAALRLRVVRTLAADLSREPADPALELLALALDDPDPATAEAAFRAVGSSGGAEAYLRELHAAWSRLDPAERERHLRHLPRGVRLTPFRGELEDLAADERRSPATRASALELLAGFAGDAELAGRVEGWLADELERYAAIGLGPEREEQGGQGGGALRLSELRCTGLVRALELLAGEAAVPALERAFQVGARPEREGGSEDLAQVAAAALGNTAPGRARLSRSLEAPSCSARARLEAALQLLRPDAKDARQGDDLERAERVAREGYAESDWELRARILKQLGTTGVGNGDGPGTPVDLTFEFLEGVAQDSSEAWELRLLALEAIAARGPRERAALALTGRLEGAGDSELVRLELARAVAPLLGELGGARARAWLAARLAAVEAQDLERGQGPAVEHARSEREPLLVSLGRASLAPADDHRAGDAGPSPAEVEALTGAWLRLPRAAAASELEARFVGRALATTAFRYRAELELGGLFARAGQAAQALARSGTWWTCDARLLAALGERLRAGGESQGARELWRAALVGLAGEAEAADRMALELRLRLGLADLAEAAGDWDELALHCGRILADWRALETPRSALAAELGDFDPARGRDPERRLASARLQALARSALARGELGLARLRADEARRELGHSSAARESQARLDAELEAADGAAGR